MIISCSMTVGLQVSWYWNHCSHWRMGLMTLVWRSRHKTGWGVRRMPFSGRSPREVTPSGADPDTKRIFSIFRGWLMIGIGHFRLVCTPCPKKTKQTCFCQNFVKFPPISIIFGRKMGNDPNICEVHSFSTSPNVRHHLTVLNANVPNCYITPNVVIFNKLLTT